MLAHLPHMTAHTLIGTLVLQPMVGHTAAGLLRHAPRIHSAACVADVQRLVVLADGQRRDAGRLGVVLAIVGGVHRQLGAEQQLALPLEACKRRREMQFEYV